MIATNICVLGILLLLLIDLYFPMVRKYRFSEIQDSKFLKYTQSPSPTQNGRDSNIYTLSYKRIAALLATFLFFIIVCNISVIDGGGGVAASAINLLYSYCDSPSLFAVLLVCVACFKQVLRLAYLYGHNEFIYRILKICKAIRFNGYLSLILFIYGCILYGGALGMLAFDIYHLEILWQIIIGFLLLVLLYIFSPKVAYLGLFALLLFYICGYENMSVLESFICPYLWVYCALYMIYSICKNLIILVNRN